MSYDRYWLCLQTIYWKKWTNKYVYFDWQQTTLNPQHAKHTMHNWKQVHRIKIFRFSKRCEAYFLVPGHFPTVGHKFDDEIHNYFDNHSESQTKSKIMTMAPILILLPLVHRSHFQWMNRILRVTKRIKIRTQHTGFYDK